MDASDGSPVTTVSATPNISVKVITTSTPLPPQATGLPEWFLLQTSDLVLRQVSRALIRGSTNEWWRAFAGVSSSIASPLVIREHDGLSVFGFDASVAVLDAMIDLLRTPELVPLYWDALPKSLQGNMELLAWRSLMRYYRFVDTENIEEPLVDDATGEPPTKKRRIYSPFEDRVIQTAHTLHEIIWKQHPKAGDFINGISRNLRCDFISAFSRSDHVSVQPPSNGLKLDPPSDKECVIGYVIAQIMNDSDRELFFGRLAACSPPRTRVSGFMVHEHKPNSKSDNLFYCKHWPAAPRDVDGPATGVTYQHHQVYQLAFSYY